MSDLYNIPSIDASYQVSVHLAKQFQSRRIFGNWPIRNKNCWWRPCLSIDRDEMSNLYNRLSIEASYQVLVNLPMLFQRSRFFRNRPIRNKNWLWQPCLLTDQDEMSNLYKGPSIDDIMLLKKLRFIWPSGYREEEFVEIDQSETRIAGGSHVC